MSKIKSKHLKTQFLKNIILLIGINLIIKPIYIFGIDAQVQNQLGPNVYGDFFSLFAFVFLFQFFLDVGIQNYNTSELSGQTVKIKSVFKYRLGSKLLLSLVFSCIVMLVCLVIYKESRFLELLPWVVGIQVMNSLFLYARSHFSMYGDFVIESLFSALDKLIMIFLVGYLLYFHDKEITIISFVSAYLLSISLACIASFVVLSVKYSLVSVAFSWSQFKELISKSFPFALVFLFMSLYTRMDAFMLERLLDDQSYSAGVYASGYRIYEAFNMLGYLFAALLLPMFSHLIGRKASVNSLVETSLDLMISLAMIISILCIAFRSEIMAFIYVDANGMYDKTFAWLMASFFFICLGYLYGTLITAGQSLKKFNLIFVVGILVNWSLNWFLIPKYQAEGAAIATFATQIFVVLSQIMLAYKLFNLDFNWLKFGRAFMLGLLLVIIVFLFKRYLALNWLYIFSISAIICGIIPFIIGQVKLKTFVELVKK